MQLTKTDPIVPYLNDFEKEIYFHCIDMAEQTKSVHYSVEFARAQSQRMDELVRRGRRRIGEKKEELLEKRAKAAGQWHESVADFTTGQNDDKWRR